MMILIDDRHGVDTAAERWRMQYCRNGVWGGLSRDLAPAEEIYRRLYALDAATATYRDVAKAIDPRSEHTGWAGPQGCKECGADGVPVVQLGQAPDYESATTEVCRNCLEKALALFPPTVGEQK